MKKMNKLLSLALLFCLMLSCGSKDEPVKQDVAAQFSGSIAGAETAEAQWRDGDRIAIFMVGMNNILSEEFICEGADNIAYKTDGSGAFSPDVDDETVFFPKDGNVDFYAYYPYTTEVNNYRIALDLTDQSNQEAIDLMYAKVGGCNRSNPNVELKFSHQLCNLILEVQPGTGLTQDDLSRLTVRVNGVDTEATFNLVDGIISGEGIPEGFTMKTVEAGKRYEAILLPTTSESHEIEFSLNNDHDGPFTWTMSTKLEGGRQYHYTNVKLSRTAAEVSGSTIKPWDDGGDNGEHEAK